MTIASVILAPTLLPQGTALSGYVPNAVSDYLLYAVGVVESNCFSLFFVGELAGIEPTQYLFSIVFYH